MVGGSHGPPRTVSGGLAGRGLVETLVVEKTSFGGEYQESGSSTVRVTVGAPVTE